MPYIYFTEEQIYDEVVAILEQLQEARLQIPFENDAQREEQRFAALRKRQNAVPEKAPELRVALYARVGSYKQLDNPMLKLTDRIRELTDG